MKLLILESLKKLYKIQTQVLGKTERKHTGSGELNWSTGTTYSTFLPYFSQAKYSNIQ
jgi:hypothetical protein